MIELRFIRLGTGRVSQFWYNDLEEVKDQAEGLMYQGDVYFGVLPRTREGGTNADVPLNTHTLWADYDTRGTDKATLFKTITGLTPRPQIVVDSGNGYHVYWLLDQMYDMVQAQQIMRAIASATSGDNVADAARVLRLPGTLNHKSAPPKSVRLLRLDLMAPKYRLSDFVYYVDVPGPEEEYEGPTFRDLYGSQPQRSKYTPQWLLDLIAHDPGKGLRSEHTFHVVAALIELGYTDGEIEQIILENPMGVGAKYHEKSIHDPSGGHKYLKYPLAEARRRVNG